MMVKHHKMYEEMKKGEEELAKKLERKENLTTKK